MSPGKLIGGLVGIFLALAGPLAIGYAGWWLALDRPDWRIGPCPFCLHLGAGAATQLAELKRAFVTEQTSFLAEQAALSRQNAAVAALSAQADAWQAASAKAVHDAASANAWRLATAAQIRAERLPADASDAEKCKAAEALLRGAAR